MNTHGSDRLSQGSCEEIRLLLPWFANGTLEAGERTEVESHLAGCAECSEEARVCQQESLAVRRAELAAPTPHPMQLTRLMARIDAEEQSREGEPGPLRRWFATLGATPTVVRWVLAAQLTGIVALAGLFAWHEPTAPAAPANYRTLADRPVVRSSGQRLRLLFTEGATEAEIRNLLLPLRAEIIAGPSPLGVYTVAIPSARQGGEPVGVVLAHLRSQAQVRFAEPVESE